MGGIESGRLVAKFAEGRLHHLLGGDRIVQDAKGQGAKADSVAGRQLPQGADVASGDPLQQRDIRGRLREHGSARKERPSPRKVTRVFNRLTTCQLPPEAASPASVAASVRTFAPSVDAWARAPSRVTNPANASRRDAPDCASARDSDSRVAATSCAVKPPERASWSK